MSGFGVGVNVSLWRTGNVLPLRSVNRSDAAGDSHGLTFNCAPHPLCSSSNNALHWQVHSMPSEARRFTPSRPYPDPRLEDAGNRRRSGRPQSARRILERDGIVAIRGAFGVEVSKGAVRDFNRLIQDARPDPYGHSQFGGMADNGELVSSPSLSALVVSPIVERVARLYLGLHGRWTYWRGYRIEPILPRQYRAFQPHVDGHLHELKAMILLSSVSNDQQCMLYWPGTHRIDWQIQRSSDTVFGRQVTEQLPEPVRATGAPGDIFLFDTNGIHSGQRNLSARRDALVVNFTATDFNYPVSRLHPAVANSLGAASRQFFSLRANGTSPSRRGIRRRARVEALCGASEARLAPEALCALVHNDRVERLSVHDDADYLAGQGIHEALLRAAHGDLNLPQYLTDVGRIVRRDRAIGRVRDLNLKLPTASSGGSVAAKSRASVVADLEHLASQLTSSANPNQADLGWLIWDLSICVAEAQRRSSLLNSLALTITALPHVCAQENSHDLLESLMQAFGCTLRGNNLW